MRRRAWLTIVPGAAFLAGCGLSLSVATATALERQLLGAYEELDRDLVLASSVRGAGAPTAEDALRGLAIEGRALMRFHRDDLVELKSLGCVAETRKATIVERPCADRDPATKRRLARVIADENRARRSVLAYAVFRIARSEGRAEPSAKDREEVERAFARLVELGHQKNDLFETEPGVFRTIE